VKVVFVYPDFERHARSNPELAAYVPAREYVGPPSLGIAHLAALTPPEHEVVFVDDRLERLDPGMEGDLFALSFFTPAATRGLEIARELRAEGKQVVVGGIFPSLMPEECAGEGIAVVVGEGEPVWADVLADAARGALKPMYRAETAYDLAGAPRPRLDLYFAAHAGRIDDYPVQHSRGCPFACDACALPGTMGRAMRFYGEEWVLDVLAECARAGKLCSFTEDSALLVAQGARIRFRRLLGRIVRARAAGAVPRFSYIGVSVPVLLGVEEELLDALVAAGIRRVYLVCGFDPVTRDAFGRGVAGALDQAARAVARCRERGILVYGSFVAGNPCDDEGVFERILAFAERAGIELAEFAIATPYPGTPLWKRLEAEGRIFDRTWKRYNDANVVFEPHGMTAGRLREGYLGMWRDFYSGRSTLAEETDIIRNRVQF
jgi:radical SAM superfamily enzyme YgiQ (UPF0313 family)